MSRWGSVEMGTRSVFVVVQVVSVHDKYAYPCCDRCHRRIRTLEDMDLFWCSYCRKQFKREGIQYRYRVNMTVSDRSQVSEVTIFGSCLQAFFGAPATSFCRFVNTLGQETENLPVSAEQIVHQAMEQCFVGSFIQLGFRIMSPCRTMSQITRSSPVQLKNMSSRLISKGVQQDKGLHKIRGTLPQLTTSVISRCSNVDDRPSVMETLHDYLEELKECNLSGRLTPQCADCTVSSYKSKQSLLDSEARDRDSISWLSSHSRQSCRQRGYSLLVSPLVLSSESSASSSGASSHHHQLEFKSSPLCLISPSKECESPLVHWSEGVSSDWIVPSINHGETTNSTTLSPAECLLKKDILCSQTTCTNLTNHWPRHRDNAAQSDSSTGRGMNLDAQLDSPTGRGMNFDASALHEQEWTELPSSEDLSAFLADMSFETTDNIIISEHSTQPLSHPPADRPGELDEFANMSFGTTDNIVISEHITQPLRHQPADRPGELEEFADYTEFPSSEDLEAFLADMDMESIEGCSNSSINSVYQETQGDSTEKLSDCLQTDIARGEVGDVSVEQAEVRDPISSNMESLERCSSDSMDSTGQLSGSQHAGVVYSVMGDMNIEPLKYDDRVSNKSGERHKTFSDRAVDIPKDGHSQSQEAQAKATRRKSSQRRKMSLNNSNNNSKDGHNQSREARQCLLWDEEDWNFSEIETQLEKDRKVSCCHNSDYDEEEDDDNDDDSLDVGSQTPLLFSQSCSIDPCKTPGLFSNSTDSSMISWHDDDGNDDDCGGDAHDDDDNDNCGAGDANNNGDDDDGNDNCGGDDNNNNNDDDGNGNDDFGGDNVDDCGGGDNDDDCGSGDANNDGEDFNGDDDDGYDNDCVVGDANYDDDISMTSCHDAHHCYQHSIELFSRSQSMFSLSSPSILQDSVEGEQSHSKKKKFKPGISPSRLRRQSTPILHIPQTSLTDTSLRKQILRHALETSLNYKSMDIEKEYEDKNSENTTTSGLVSSQNNNTSFSCCTSLKTQDGSSENMVGTPELFSYNSSCENFLVVETDADGSYQEQEDSLISDSLLDCSYL